MRNQIKTIRKMLKFLCKKKWAEIFLENQYIPVCIVYWLTIFSQFFDPHPIISSFFSFLHYFFAMYIIYTLLFNMWWKIILNDVLKKMYCGMVCCKTFIEIIQWRRWEFEAKFSNDGMDSVCQLLSHHNPPSSMD